VARSTAVGRIAAIAALAGAVLVAGFLLLGGGNTYTVTANFQNASQLVKGNLVEVGGVKAGTIKDISLGPNNTAMVEMEVDGAYSPLPEGTIATIRSQSLSGVANRYIQLVFPEGDQAGKPIPDGGELPLSNTVSEVDLDQLFNTLDPKTIGHFKDVITGFARAYDGIGPQTNRGFKSFNPFLSTSREVFGQLTADENRFRHLIIDSASLSGALADRSPDLEQFVSNANRMFSAIASQNQNLASAIGQLPGFMRNFNTTAVNLRARRARGERLVFRQDRIAGPLLGLGVGAVELRLVRDDLDVVAPGAFLHDLETGQARVADVDRFRLVVQRRHDFPAIHSAVKTRSVIPTTKIAMPSVTGPYRPRLNRPPGSLSSWSCSLTYVMISRFWSGVISSSPNTGMFCGPVSIAA